MNNLTFNASNYSTYEKKFLGTFIERICTVIDEDCCKDNCDKCPIKHLCNDSVNALKSFSENGYILTFQSKNIEKSIDKSTVICYN